MKRFPGFVCGVLIYFQLLLVLVGASTSFGKFFSKKFVLNIVGPLPVCLLLLTFGWLQVVNAMLTPLIVICK